MNDNNPSAHSTGAGARIALIVVAALAVIGLVGGGAWAVMRNAEPSDTEKPAPNFHALEATTEQVAESVPPAEQPSATTPHSTQPAGPSEEEKCTSMAEAQLSQFRNPVVMYCDGSWLRAGEYRTDLVRLYTWADGGWQRYYTDGKTVVTNLSCYDRGTLEAQGAPAELLDQLLLCDGDAATSTAETTSSSGGWSEKCDGRYILIVESVLIPPNTEPYSAPYRVQHRYPGSEILQGGACTSLRAWSGDNMIVAVYYDAGHSVDKVCELKAQYGGNARSLNNNADFTDPC